jgi:hypothetical protein
MATRAAVPHLQKLLLIVDGAALAITGERSIVLA